ncbi:rhodanese-like domain-containing protein [uncultured Arthrobacter sp.]|uniref:rhodanese-like domain-containing protein n=1 Tax=uncultured Arthrobacter sp. TaxID=114050 RepID=UPI003217C9BF
MAATRTITADDLAATWPAAVVVDVRGREEYAIARIPGSLNIPLDDLPSRLKDLPNTTLHLLCGSGKRSSRAAQILTDRGYETVNVAGGITEWYRNGHPVIYAAAPADNPHPDRPYSLSSLRNRLVRRAARTS